MKKPSITIPKRKNRLFFAFGIILIISSLYFGGFDFFKNWLNERNAPINAQALVSNEPVVTPDPLLSGTPVSIKIESVGIALEVAPGVYNPNDQSWSLSLDKAHWGNMTYPANNKSGLTFIYAHNRRGVFKSLPNVKLGDIAIVTTDNNQTFTYSFTASTVTKPEDASIFNYSGKPILVLQTCTGTWYENRQLFVFDYASVL
jgi:LPXTG-site transpeptidase (sortase) family protein